MRKSALSPDAIRDAPPGCGDYQAPGPFCLIPPRATVDTRLHKYASTFGVLAFVCSYAKAHTGTFFMNQLTIAEAIGISQQAVHKHMKKLVEYGYIQKIRKEDRSRAWGKRGAVWRVIYDPRMTTKEVMNSQPQTEEEMTQAAQETIAIANRGAKGQLSKGKKPVDKYDSQQPAGCNSGDGNDTENNLQVVQKNNPEVVSIYNLELEDKNNKMSFVERKEKTTSHTHTRARDTGQPERACRAICAAYGSVMQEATGIRWQYDDRQVSIAASLLNMGYTEETFTADAKQTAEWFISKEQQPPVSLAWFAKKQEAKSKPATEAPDISAILGKVKASARW